jgi:CheY-like chemotaxis protein
LTQVISNLLNNAARFTADGGHIVLAVRREGARAVLSVKNDGVSIPPDMRERVFDMFTQIEWPAQRQQEGLGIGLALVKRLVEMHDGEIEARSDGPGRGSELVVRLPIAGQGEASPTQRTSAAAAGAAGGTGAAAGNGSRPERILVVDDNVDAAETLSRLLRLQAHEGRVAYDGLAALAAARDMNPDVVLLDIGLPAISGYDVAHRIREKRGDSVLIVAITGWGQEKDLRRAEEAGIDQHFTKPVDFEALVALLERTAPHARGESSTH